MNKKIYTALMMAAASLQVACGDSKKDKMAEFMAQCQQTQACQDMYKNAANNAQIQSVAAQAGLPQVAAPGTTPQQGQVASTTVVPASISDAQLKAAAQKIQTQLTTLDQQQAASTPAAAPVASSSYSPASAVEVGVTRLNSTGIVSTSSPMRNPSSLAPASTSTPLAQQEEVSGGASAGQ